MVGSLDDCSLECPGAMRSLDAKSVSCEVSCEVSRRRVLQGVASMGVVLRGMSSACDESLSGSSGGIPVSRVYSCGSSS